jgi:hypothetical protein
MGYPLVARLAVAGLLIAWGTGTTRAIEVAGELFVDLDAATFNTGDTVWQNAGTYTNFDAVGTPTRGLIESTPAVFFDGNSAFMGLDSAPAGLTGPSPTRSIEVWALNPTISQEETLVSWGHRGGPDGSNMSFNYGFRGEWGAVGHWGGGGPDLGWIDNGFTGGAPEANQWHHLVYTFDAETTRVYANGVLWNEENVVENFGVELNTYEAPPIAIASQWDDDFNLTAGIRGSLAIGKVRIHDGVLTDAQILANYESERASFVSPPATVLPTPAPLTEGPVHRYSFDGNTLDSVGNAHGALVDNTGNASFANGRLTLGNEGFQNSNNEDGDYVDLPNGVISGLGNNATIETWTTWNGNAPGWWQRVFDFGTSDAGEDSSGGAPNSGYVFLTPFGGDTSTRFGFRDGSTLEERIIQDTSTLTAGEERHVAIVWDGEESITSLYIDGELIGESEIHFDLSELDDVNNWLGRAQWADASYVGSYNEFRLYNYALSPNQVHGNFVAGPDTVNLGGGTAGDYNGDGMLTVADLDLQSQAILDNGPAATFDENGDGVVNQADREIWVKDHRGTWMGDANLDGEFSSSDLVVVFQAGRYETGAAANWAQGDFTGDMLFNTADLVAAFQDGGFEQGPRGAVSAVPEPSGLLLLSLGLLMGCRRPRRVAP